jgi:UDP-glucose 4-epimerase
MVKFFKDIAACENMKHTRSNHQKEVLAVAKVLITGGAGFIGSHIAQECILAGHQVLAIDDLSSGKVENLPNGVLFRKIDVSDKEAIQEIFQDYKPEYVLHQAAQISVSRSVREPEFDAMINIVGLINTLKASVEQKVKTFVFASSGGVLYGDVYSPADEESPAMPVSPYGISKLTGEYYLKFFSREYNLSTIALRYANVYGPRQDPHGEAGVVAIFLQKMLANQAPVINGDGKYVRDYVFVKDVARANLLAMSSGGLGFKAYNVGTGIGTDVNALERGLREKLLEVIGKRGDKLDIPAVLYGPHRAGDLRSSLLDCNSIRCELGWETTVSIDEGLSSTAEWFAGQ